MRLFFFDKLRLIASASIVELFINVQVADMSTVVKFPQHLKHCRERWVVRKIKMNMEYNLITIAAIILALNVAQSEANLWDDITDKIVSIFELKISEN